VSVLNLTSAAPADIAVSLSGPASAAGGTVFHENVTVTDLGPSNVTRVATNFYVPPGLTVIAAPGATTKLGTVDWVDPTLTPAAKVVYHVTFKVGAHPPDTATIGGDAVSTAYDPHPANNVAITTVQLVHSPL
jgi:Domain of unknown function DUF11